MKWRKSELLVPVVPKQAYFNHVEAVRNFILHIIVSL